MRREDIWGLRPRASESVGIVRLLMGRGSHPDVVRSVDAAVEWLQRVHLADGRWARFYEFRTNRPLFAGRDGVVRYNVDEIERERRECYAWFGTWPRRLIEEEYPAWKERVTRRQRGSDIVDRPFEGRNGLPTAAYPPSRVDRLRTDCSDCNLSIQSG